MPLTAEKKQFCVEKQNNTESVQVFFGRNKMPKNKKSPFSAPKAKTKLVRPLKETD